MSDPSWLQFEYAEATVERLKIRFMTITSDEVNEGLRIAARHGIDEEDAKTILFIFLETFTPYHEARGGYLSPDQVRIIRFPGWPAVTAVLRTLTQGVPVELRNRVLAYAFGLDALRIAAAVATERMTDARD